MLVAVALAHKMARIAWAFAIGLEPMAPNGSLAIGLEPMAPNGSLAQGGVYRDPAAAA